MTDDEQHQQQQQQQHSIMDRYWPVDPLHTVFVKLFIATLLKLPPLTSSAFSLRGRPVSRAEVVGWIVRRDEKNQNSRLMLTLDDATGLLEVLVWERRFEREPTIDWSALQIGTLVRIRGKLSYYAKRVQLTAFSAAI